MGARRFCLFLCCVSWLLPQALKQGAKLSALGYKVRYGGPATGRFENFGSVVHKHNPNATTTSTGCINSCSFCRVPTFEGDLKEKEKWEIKPTLYDNNVLACSRRHLDKVIDSLLPVPQVDFNQGLDARILNSYQAGRLAELDMKCVRLAWDNVNTESQFRNAVKLLRNAGFPKNKIHIYVLIGYKDSPEDALYRLESIRKLGCVPNPMRYQPIDTPKRNSHVAPGWTNDELIRYMRYWQNLRYAGSVPFAEFRNDYKKV